MEQFLSYIWQNRLFDSVNLKTVCGLPVRIIDVGIPNRNAGPDFFNAKVVLGNTLWAGNVEIHIKSSDWYKHHHQDNKEYNSVILHVVKQCDAKIYRQNGEEIHQLELSYPSSVEESYEFLLSANTAIPCSLRIKEVPSIIIHSWLDALLIERLEEKTSKVTELLQSYNNDYKEVLYILLARHFGTGINTDAFERLARSLPFKTLLKHSDSSFQMEALLFGQAGLLSEKNVDSDYRQGLQREYHFLRQKYTLQNMDECAWKSHRIRPAGFPEIRIAQLAALYKVFDKLFHNTLTMKNPTELNDILLLEVSPFWQTHYNFRQQSSPKKKTIGMKMKNNLIINAVVPFMIAYGKAKADSKLSTKAIGLLEEIQPENNRIVREWQSLGIDIKNAADTQAVLQLKKYCEQKKCLYCRIGQKLLSRRTDLSNHSL